MSPYRLALASLVVVACGGKIDPSAEGVPPSQRPGPAGGTSSGTSGVSSSSSASSTSGSTNTSCYAAALIPFEADFENGAIGDDFKVNSPSAFTIEWDHPITGSASLRVNPNRGSYIAREVKSVCAARLQFTLRASAEFVKGGGNLARVNAGSRRFTIEISAGGGLRVAEEVYTTNALGTSVGASIGDIFPEDPTVITLDADLNAQKLTYGFYSGMSSGPSVVVDMTKATLVSPPAITSIELGTTPGPSSNPQGLYWLDDVQIQ